MKEKRIQEIRQGQEFDSIAMELFGHLSGIMRLLGAPVISERMKNARDYFCKRSARAATRLRVEASRQSIESKKPQFRMADSRRCSGVAVVARLIGCHPNHLSYILHGERKANEKLRSRLASMGITTTVDGEKL